MRYSPTRSKKLIAWARPWRHFEAKPADPAEPSIGALSEELGEQLEAAQGVIDRLLGYMSPEQRLEEMQRINGSTERAP